MKTTIKLVITTDSNDVSKGEGDNTNEKEIEFNKYTLRILDGIRSSWKKWTR